MYKNIEIVEQGHLWVGIYYKGKDYSLTYNYGLDITVIFEEDYNDEDGRTLKYINYFCGGFNCDTFEPDNDILDSAIYYIDEYREGK